MLRTAFQVAPDGTAFLAQLVWERFPGNVNVPRIALLTRSAAGQWLEEQVPVEPGTGTGLTLAPGDAGHLGLFLRRAGERLAYVEKLGGAWGAPVDLCQHGYDDFVAAAQRLPDGRIVAVGSGKLPDASEPAVFCARAEGSWGCQPLSPWPSGSGISAGFGPDGRAWVVEFPAVLMTEAAVYAEP
ncbi:MAG: hypothetical protein QM767_19580 [Anaeromyxobacter sp.]